MSEAVLKHVGKTKPVVTVWCDDDRKLLSFRQYGALYRKAVFYSRDEWEDFILEMLDDGYKMNNPQD